MKFYYRPIYQADKPETWNAWACTTDIMEAYRKTTGSILTEAAYIACCEKKGV